MRVEDKKKEKNQGRLGSWHGLDCYTRGDSSGEKEVENSLAEENREI